MRRREFIALFSSSAAWPLEAAAQKPPKIARVGFIAGGTPGRNFEAFRQGLTELGHVEGQTITLEIRWGDAL
jgi:putative tryptophan/tyrosine transport system substrate-binding protein